MSSKRINVLYVDDEKNNLISFQSLFSDKFTIYTANSGDMGLAIFRKQSIHIIICDQIMPVMDGTTFLAEARKLNSMPIRILLTGFPDAAVYKNALNTVQLYRILEKPYEYEEILSAINDGYELFQYRQAGKDFIKKLIEANEKLLNYHDQKLINAKLLIDAYESKN